MRTLREITQLDLAKQPVEQLEEVWTELNHLQTISMTMSPTHRANKLLDNLLNEVSYAMLFAKCRQIFKMEESNAK